WTLDGRPVALRYEPSPWLGYAVIPADGGWEVRRAETRPDVRVDVVHGEVARSLFGAVEEAGGAAQLAIDLPGVFEWDFGFPADAHGRIGSAGAAGGNGIAMTLKHRSAYETMYTRLSRLGPGVRPGGRVAPRQVIGYVGATGLATGPHLDYRVAKNGHFVNPLGEKFIPGEPIAAAERGAFTAQARELVRRLEAAAPF